VLFAGELEGGHGRDGLVYFDDASIQNYLECHGVGVVADAWNRSSTVRPARTTTGRTG
jgi:hypothetical protein